MAPQIEYAEVQRRLLTACKTLRALPEKDKHQVYRTYWPATADDPNMSYGYADAIMPRFRPTPSQVSDCLVAMDWTRGMPQKKFRFIWWRSFDMSFTRMAGFIHREHDTARRYYIEAMRDAWMIANTRNSIAS